MSPREQANYTDILMINKIGNMTYGHINTVQSIAPVVNIKPEYAEKMSGTGYMNDPYVVE